MAFLVWGMPWPCSWKTLFPLISLPAAHLTSFQAEWWGPTVPEMIYGSLLYKPFHIPPHPLFANSSWYVNETLDSELWLTVLKTIVQDTWTAIELVFRSIKGPLLHRDYLRLPFFPQGPGERNALKNRRYWAWKVKRKGVTCSQLAREGDAL